VAGKDLPDRMPPAQADRLKNLVVVCREGVVITAYRNGNGFRNVKKKGKRLKKDATLSKMDYASGESQTIFRNRTNVSHHR
jgi:hypothetical protein